MVSPRPAPGLNSPSPPTPSTTTTSTTKLPQYPDEWSGTDDGLSADVKVDDPAPAADTVVHFTIEVHSQTWTNAPEMDFGNGNDAGPGVPGHEWAAASYGRCNPGPNDFVYRLDFAYRMAGTYTFQFINARQDCGDNGGHGGPVFVRGTIHVGGGGYRYNGPLPPVVALSGQFTPTNGDPSMVYEQEEAVDADGWVDQISLDWGDGSPPYTRSFPPPPDCDPANHQPSRPEEWPSGGLASSTESQQFLSHKYPAGGSYTVTATVHSEGCNASEPQMTSITETVNSPY